jgi:hypothetical protein
MWKLSMIWQQWKTIFLKWRIQIKLRASCSLCQIREHEIPEVNASAVLFKFFGDALKGYARIWLSGARFPLSWRFVNPGGFSEGHGGISPVILQSFR